MKKLCLNLLTLLLLSTPAFADRLNLDLTYDQDTGAIVATTTLTQEIEREGFCNLALTGAGNPRGLTANVGRNKEGKKQEFPGGSRIIRADGTVRLSTAELREGVSFTFTAGQTRPRVRNLYLAAWITECSKQADDSGRHTRRVRRSDREPLLFNKDFVPVSFESYFDLLAASVQRL